VKVAAAATEVSQLAVGASPFLSSRETWKS